MPDNDKEKPQKKWENQELQTIMDEYATLTQEYISEILNVTHKCIRERLHPLGKWVPHALTKSQMESRRVTCKQLFNRHQKKSFLHRNRLNQQLQVDKDGP